MITINFLIFQDPSPRLLLCSDTPERLLHPAGQVELLEEGDAAPVAGGAGDQVTGEHGPGVTPAHDAHPARLGVATQRAQHQPQGPSALTAPGLDTGVCDLGDISLVPGMLGPSHGILVLHLQLVNDVVKDWVVLLVRSIDALPPLYVVVVQSSHRFDLWTLHLESVVEGFDWSWCVASLQS